MNAKRTDAELIARIIDEYGCDFTDTAVVEICRPQRRRKYGRHATLNLFQRGSRSPRFNEVERRHHNVWG